MTPNMLKVVASAMKSMKLNYEYGNYSGNDTSLYFTGEYSETPAESEDGMQECTFILNGFTRKSFLELEKAKAKIEAFFPKVSGYMYTDDEGNVLIIFYNNANIVPEDDPDLKRIQVNLLIKEWSVNV